jgi:hypothetical protein
MHTFFFSFHINNYSLVSQGNKKGVIAMWMEKARDHGSFSNYREGKKIQGKESSCTLHICGAVEASDPCPQGDRRVEV